MQKVTLYSSAHGDYPLALVGEGSYQNEIKSVLGYEDNESSRKEDGFTAELIFEDENPHDRGNAIRVDIDHETVGYLSREDAKKYRNGLAKHGLKNVSATCYAAISGRYNNDIDDILFGVWLDLDIDRLIVLSTPTKPPTKRSNPSAAPQILVKKTVIQNLVEIWRKGLLEKVTLIIAAFIILNFIFQFWKELNGY